jgi:hypothetical protein
MPLDFTKLDHSVLGPARRSPLGRGTGRHFVQIYRDDPSLVDAVATFLSHGIKSGDAAIVIGRPDHLRDFEDAVSSTGADLQAARDLRRWRTIDSHEMLGSFMVNGMPVPSLFVESVGSLIRSTAPEGNLRIFGEMVADLWADGGVPAAMSVEDLWNDLTSTYRFDLFCAYPADLFRAADLTSLARVCGRHSQVIPPTFEMLA